MSKGKVLVLVFSHIEYNNDAYNRPGAEEDEKLIKDIFKRFYRSECEVYKNKTKEEVVNALNDGR